MGDDIWSGGFFGTKSTGNTYQIKYADYDGSSDYFVCDSCLGDVIFRNYIPVCGKCNSRNVQIISKNEFSKRLSEKRINKIDQILNGQ